MLPWGSHGPDVRYILTADDLRKLRAHQIGDSFIENARNSVIDPYPPTGELVNKLPNFLFKDAAMSGKARERCIIAILTSKEIEVGFLLPVHFYWGLMEGLEPAQIAETIFVSSLYSGGLPNYLSTIQRFRIFLDMLCDIVRSGSDLDPIKIAGKIRERFSFEGLYAVASANGGTGERKQGGNQGSNESHHTRDTTNLEPNNHREDNMEKIAVEGLVTRWEERAGGTRTDAKQVGDAANVKATVNGPVRPDEEGRLLAPPLIGAYLIEKWVKNGNAVAAAEAAELYAFLKALKEGLVRVDIDKKTRIQIPEL